jgi:hypothetical protein
MARKANPLTDAAIRNAKPAEKTRKLFDGGGLYLEITPSGGKLWRPVRRQSKAACPGTMA